VVPSHHANAGTTGARFHFISGLPRSGSTLLAALLRQNPRFHAGMTSPVGTLVNGVIGQLTAGSEFGSVVDTAQRRRLLRGLFDSYYADRSAGVIFDTNRLWCSRMPTLMDLFPEAKVIACVRNVAWIMDSIERLYRANPYENTRLFADDTERATVYSRVDTLAQRNRLVGFAWSALREACYGEHAGSILLVDYDLLARTPERVLRLVYEFLDEPWHPHDFDDVGYEAHAFDRTLGVDGMHTIRQRVEPIPRHTLLPPDVFEKYSALSFWDNLDNSATSVIRIKQTGNP